MRFKGKVLFATGGGSGIAEATARRFAMEGGRVAVVDLNEEKAAAVARDLPDAIGLACDVADEESVREAVAATVRAFGAIDCVFNAAGHADFGPLEEWELSRFYRMLHVHVGGTFLVCKHVIPLLKKHGGGAIVNVASIAAFAAQLHNTPYGAAKAGITGLTRQLALELAPIVRVNAIAPGRIRSGMTIPIYAQRGGGDVQKGMTQSALSNPLKRIGEPDEIAAPVCFMLSGEASYMTGQVLIVDGGDTIV
jgi:NAD(P)-dependent dehydrogenase (short-subunit alcohol dehydrogenase family)